MRRNARLSRALLEAFFALGVIAGVAGVISGIVAMVGSEVSAIVELPHQQLSPGRPLTGLITAGSVTLLPETGTLTLLDPTLAQRLAAGVPELIAALTVLLVSVQLWRAVRAMNGETAFVERTVSSVVAAARTAAVGVGVYVVVQGPAQVELAAAAPDSLDLPVSAFISFAPLIYPLALFAFAEVLRQGLTVNRELEGVV